MTGAQFLTSLKAKISPATIKSQKGTKDGLTIITSTNKQLTVKRQRVKACANQAALDTYVNEVTA